VPTRRPAGARPTCPGSRSAGIRSRPRLACPLDDELYVVAEERLPGSPLQALDATRLAELSALVELQADAGLPADERNFAAYEANVLFDGWDHVWRDAERASPAAARLCSRLRRWLVPVWGCRLPAPDFAHEDLNLSNVLSDGTRITGVVDWDEAGLNSRAIDLTTLAFECRRLGRDEAVEPILERVIGIAGEEGLRCHVAYRAIGHLAGVHRRARPDEAAAAVAVAEWLLDTLGAEPAA
jgi:aminoglycoside phosphotransferase (APT) family kinase protein